MLINRATHLVTVKRTFSKGPFTTVIACQLFGLAGPTGYMIVADMSNERPKIRATWIAYSNCHPKTVGDFFLSPSCFMRDGEL